MRKSTIIFIMIIYLASIIVIGFFGMKVKIYDEVKYVKSIEISAESENKDSYEFTYLGKDKNSGDNLYKLNIHFKDYHIVDQDGKSMLSMIFLPKVTYDTGDIAGTTEKIIYSLDSTIDLEDKGYVKLYQTGRMDVFVNYLAFTVNVTPEHLSGIGTNAIIDVVII